jgi:uncharacterized coiled-coil DUF342 family protein
MNFSCFAESTPQLPDQSAAYRCEVYTLRAEMKQCTNQVQKLAEEFSEMKKELEAARKEVDTTRYTLNEITAKLLAHD